MAGPLVRDLGGLCPAAQFEIREARDLREEEAPVALELPLVAIPVGSCRGLLDEDLEFGGGLANGRQNPPGVEGFGDDEGGCPPFLVA